MDIGYRVNNYSYNILAVKISILPLSYMIVNSSNIHDNIKYYTHNINSDSRPQAARRPGQPADQKPHGQSGDVKTWLEK